MKDIIELIEKYGQHMFEGGALWQEQCSPTGEYEKADEIMNLIKLELEKLL